MEKSHRPNRIREALGHLQDQQPPYFREYLRRFQEDPTSRVFAPLAEAYRRLGRLDEAAAICREGLEHHPDFHAGRVVLAKCLIARKEMAAARVELERVVHAVPENLMAQKLLGESHLALGNKAAALHALKMALLLAPNDVPLAEKVHTLETGEEVLVKEPLGPSTPESRLPENETDLEIPPLWSLESPPAPVPVQPTEPGQMEVLPNQPEQGAGEEPFMATMGLQEILSDDESMVDDEAFKVEHVSSIFEPGDSSRREITTETLGDLYLAQGQYDKALRIFEKLKPSALLQKKIQSCRAGLGVDMDSVLRARKVALLKAIVARARDCA